MSSVPSEVSKYMGNAVKLGEIWGNIIINVKAPPFNAKGDGVNDDTAALQAAIAACPAFGVVELPPPTVTYKITATIEINKPLHIRGGNHKTDGTQTTVQFSAGVKTGFHVTNRDFYMENMSISTLDTTNTFVAGIHFDNATMGSLENMQLLNVKVNIAHIFGAGIKGQNLITSSFKNVRTFQGSYGFHLYNTGTSVSFEECWAIGSVDRGYRIENYQYCSFMGCACDSGNFCDYGYDLQNCTGFSFVGCGSEAMGKGMFNIYSGGYHSIMSGFCHVANQKGTSVATFAEITNGSKGNSFISCYDDTTGVIPNVRIDATSDYPFITNSNFPHGFSDNGTISTNPVARGYIQIGRFSINENAAGSSLVILSNRGIGTQATRLGVISTGIGAWQGYIDSDGSLLIGPGGTVIRQHLSVTTSSQNFGSVPANSTAELTVTVTGAAVGDTVSITPNATLANGFVWSGYVSAADTVKIRVANVTTGALDPDSAGATWRVDVWKH